MKQIFNTLFLANITVFITISLIIFPDQALEASIRGLNIWWEIVFPSLLPFFIAAELLIGFGVVSFLGVLFEPIMRPIFNVPGVGSFAWIMGMASGYPSGAKISVRLREKNKITQIEAERLISFTNASSPLFIIGAVSVGFFHDEKIGLLIAISHYLGNVLVGVCMRFYGRNERNINVTTDKQFFLIKALKSMHRTRVNDKRPLGKIIGDAVISSVQTLVMIGGFIILFSVFTKMLFIIGLTPIIAEIFKPIFHLFSVPTEFTTPFITGLFEITMGAQFISQVETNTLLSKIVLVSFIIGFNGFSVQAQVASIIANTDIRFIPYFIARILHGTFASLLTILLFRPLYLNLNFHSIDELPVFNTLNRTFHLDYFEMLKEVGPIITIVFLGISSTLLFNRLRKNI